MSWPGKAESLKRVSSVDYRESSQVEYDNASELIESNKKKAKIISERNSISLDEAYSQFLPDFDDILVKSTRLEGYDSKLGDKYTATNLSICCISKLTQGIYNDTLCVHGDSIVTYKSTFSLQNTHSGDKKVKYGLEHVISFNSENFTEKAYVISSPWINRKSAEVSTLFDTDPILEIRAKESNVLRRYVIPQDYSESDNHTACINAIVEYINGKWEVTICRKFIYGFADDLDKIKESIKALNL